jgi:hypothetical protein
MASSRPRLPVLLHTAFYKFTSAISKAPFDPEVTNFRAEKSVA